MKNLLLLTNDFPYSTPEAYLETEILYAARHFENVYIVSLSGSRDGERAVPANVRAVKRDRHYKPVRCFLHALFSLFTPETFSELRALGKLEHKPSLLNAVKAWIKCRMIKKRLDLCVKELGIDTKETVGYSYWMNEFAYFLAKRSKDFGYVFCRAHGFELRDHEVYLPFRRVTDAGLSEISFISGNARRQYERILRPLGGSSPSLEKRVSYLGVNSDGRLSPVDKSTFRVASCSNVYPLKRLDLLVDALAALPGDLRIEWVHFGAGADLEKIKAYASEKLAAKENIKYEFKGQTPNAEVIGYYKTNAVSLFINVSDIEGLPVSVMEAIACGIPAAARDVGGNSEIVVTGESGYLLPSGDDVPAIAADLEKIVREYDSLFDREKIVRFYEERFNADRNYGEFYDRLDSIAGKRSG